MRDYLFFQTRDVANEQLVRQIDRKRHRELFWVALTGLVLAAALVAYAWPQFQLIQLGYKMEELRVRRERLVEVQRHLELQLATESSPARIERIAESELGLTYPHPSTVVIVEPVEPVALDTDGVGAASVGLDGYVSRDSTAASSESSSSRVGRR